MSAEFVLAREREVEMDGELKPCPFCGGEAHARQALMWDEDYNEFAVPDRWTVECDTDGCMGEVGCAFYKTEAEAVEAWNTRAGKTCEQNLRGHVRELEAEPFDASGCRHVQPDTWERIVADAVLHGHVSDGGSGDGDADVRGLVTRCEALAGEAV